MGGTSIEQLTQQVRTFCEERDWDQYHGPKDLAIGVITEASELLEHFRFQSEEQSLALLQDPKQREDIEDELADVLFFVLRFAQRFDVDLEKALMRKIGRKSGGYNNLPERQVNRRQDIGGICWIESFRLSG